MSETFQSNRENFLLAYIKKQEELYMELTRKLVDSEAKKVLLESLASELNSKQENYTNSLAEKDILVKESLSSLEKLTIEKNKIQETLDKVNQRFSELQNEYNKKNDEFENSKSSLSALHNEVERQLQEINGLVAKLNQANDFINEKDSQNRNLVVELHNLRQELGSLDSLKNEKTITRKRTKPINNNVPEQEEVF